MMRFRTATLDDLGMIVELLADDPLGAGREKFEDPLPPEMCRATIEGLRISRAHRGSRLGAKLVEFAIEEARKANCGLVQLTTDRTRGDAHRFYEKLGFEPSHIGMKLKL